MSSGIITMTGAEYDALAGKIASLEAELARLRAGQEPVEWRCRVAGSDHWAHFPTKRCRFCEPLYTTPQPSAVPDGWKLVPVEPTEQMANAYWDAYQKANDTHFMHCYRAILAAARQEGKV